ncbi:hypothetical protein N7532_003061 [Penicillium argentinense]|uniref:Zn(2)-C6 fungal-type domain-containing protein n=1 Tax=Penicillium argentinense TaxID=1131581 RepID=A0A9W9FM86_9EURO|nr:uncharacterized protein N7532_003061 [Penicillium argentinense]KAJ5102532.1 hypothetical protein N7532_003061 [Penicillium argentinense]
MTRTADNVKPPKLRTKTFTGCWTCRDRRVKCDDQRPACRRCLRSGWVCQGYGLRLGWSQAPGSRSHRRQIWSSTPQSSLDLSSTAVTALLAELDGCSAEGSAHQRGPFSVFSATSSGTNNEVGEGEGEMSSLAEDRSLGPQMGESNNGNGIDNARENKNGNTPSSGDHSDESSSDPLDVQSTMPTSPSIASPARGSPASSGPINLTHNVRHDAICTIRRQAASRRLPRNENELATNLPFSRNIGFVMSIYPMQLPKPETELVHHWVVFLSGNMLLIDTPDNPCRTIFMPMALKGLDASFEESNIHLSIFHAICASSAFSLFHLRGDPRYQSVAMHHDQLALRHLRHNLQKAKRLDEPTLAAVLSCITAEAMSGRRTRWRTHVAGGLGLLENELNGGWIRGPAASRLLQSYLSLSSLCNLPMSSQLVSLLNGPSELRYYLERSHGITTPLVQFLAYITTIIESKAEVSIEELDRLELQLYLNFPVYPTLTHRELLRFNTL